MDAALPLTVAVVDEPDHASTLDSGRAGRAVINQRTAALLTVSADDEISVEPCDSVLPSRTTDRLALLVTIKSAEEGGPANGVISMAPGTCRRIGVVAGDTVSCQALPAEEVEDDPTEDSPPLVLRPVEGDAAGTPSDVLFKEFVQPFFGLKNPTQGVSEGLRARARLWWLTGSRFLCTGYHGARAEQVCPHSGTARACIDARVYEQPLLRWGAHAGLLRSGTPHLPWAPCSSAASRS
jgi:hypothetical protein